MQNLLFLGVDIRLNSNLKLMTGFDDFPCLRIKWPFQSCNVEIINCIEEVEVVLSSLFLAGEAFSKF